MNVLTREEVRQVDRTAIDDLGMSGLVLMENAGRGTVDVLERIAQPKRVLICCGKGNNAGDGFVIARHLDLHDVAVDVILASDPAGLTGDAKANYDLLSKTRVRVSDRISELARANDSDWILDALLGTGATGDPRPPFDAAIEAMNDSNARRMAIDIPSGLDADSGKPSRWTVKADHTCTFVAAKPGFLESEAQPYIGQVHIVSIGVPHGVLVRFGLTGRTAND